MGVPISRHSGRYVGIRLCAAVLIVLATTPLSANAQSRAESPTEADAYIRHTFNAQDTSRYDEAAEIFYDLLTGDIDADDPAQREIRRRHLRYALAVMPPQERPSESTDAQVDGDIADAVAAWWRRQDPFPGTHYNERLEEHLARVAHAAANFSDGSGALGVDVRGELFIRFGAPSLRMSVRINEVIRAFDIPATVSVPKLPENELWVYDHVHDAAQYFFLRSSNREPFRLASPFEMIPKGLLSGLNRNNDRGRIKTEVTLQVLEEIYAQLALAHPVYGSTFDRIAHYRGRPPSRGRRDDQFVRSTLGEASAHEIDAAGHREKVVPTAYSNTTESIDTFPVEMRWARFLQPGGGTRVEIYWQVHAEEVQPTRRRLRELEETGHTPSDLYLISVSVARSSPDYRSRTIERRHYRVRLSERTELPAQKFIVGNDTEIVHLGMQWDVHWAHETASGVLPVGPILKRAVTGVDSVFALHGRGETLEASDLRPVASASASDTLFASRRIDPASPPSLYFELYNLHFGPDDRTRYSIEYEVVRGGETLTAARSTLTGIERTTQELIGFDLGDAARAGPIRINVRATDEVTGEVVARSIRFEP